MKNNKAREINSPIIKQLINETTPEELAKIDAEMSNNKQSSVEWFFNQLVANRIIVINGTTYWDKVKTKYEMLLEQAKEMELERIESEIIKQCAEQSTSEASKYADGYSSGYKTALELVKWKIDNELITK
jgi:hypothetical protein